MGKDGKEKYGRKNSATRTLNYYTKHHQFKVNNFTTFICQSVILHRCNRSNRLKPLNVLGHDNLEASFNYIAFDMHLVLQIGIITTRSQRLRETLKSSNKAVKNVVYVKTLLLAYCQLIFAFLNMIYKHDLWYCCTNFHTYIQYICDNFLIDSSCSVLIRIGGAKLIEFQFSISCRLISVAYT